MNPRWTVYRHIHDESGRSYIGLSNHTMMHRWNQHVSQAKNSKNGRWHFPNAIRKYGKESFSHEVLQVCASLEDANQAEQFWIWTYDTSNPFRGFNIALGGSHTPHPIRKNPWNDPEYRARASAAAKARWADPVIRAKNLAATKAGLNTPESKTRRSVASKIALSNPAIKVKMSIASKNRVFGLEARANMSKAQKGRKVSPETRMKLSVTSRRIVMSSEAKEKLRKILTGRKLSSEHCFNMSKSQKGKKLSSEHKAKISLANMIRMSRPEFVNKSRRYSDTYKICVRHGQIPLSECNITKRKNGSMRVRCKQCIFIENARRYVPILNLSD
jgi:translation initiation factor 2 beta subunit (eIF-2beta)/eIF-5